MAAFWLVCTGRQDYKPVKERFGLGDMGERQHIIGPVESPILICKKKEVPKLVSKEFWFIYEIWQYFHNGFGLPNGDPWNEQDPDLMRMILNMEFYYKQNFSIESVQLKYMEALLKRK